MRTISICATKGGTGKSTLCTALATYVHGIGQRVCLIDLDAGQASSTAWAAARARANLAGPELIKVRSLRADLRRLAARGTAYVFIDSPPTLDDGGIVEAAVGVAEVILSPCRPSILDLGAAQTIAELAGEVPPVGFVLTDVTTGTGWQSTNKEAAKALADVGHVFKATLTHRPAYVNAMAAGKTGPEIDKVAATEIAALWREIIAWLK